MSIRSNVAIIYSEASREAFAAKAKAEDELYTFRGSRATLHWIKGEEAYLAVNGCASILRRLGVKFDILNENEGLPGLLNEYYTSLLP